MPGRVEHHPDTLLRLIAGLGRARPHRPGDGGAEILDRDVQVLVMCCLPASLGQTGRV